MDLIEEEKKLENKCQEVQDKVVRQNILLIFNKDSNKVYSQYTINISIPKNNSKSSKDDYEFILKINLTSKRIFLFSMNINPISDGRNILPIITPSKKNNFKSNFFKIDDIDLLQIINNLKQFISEEKFTNLYGCFYLGEEYDSKMIEKLQNLEKIWGTRLDVLNGGIAEAVSLCTISDEYFCLYEKNSNNNYILVFYSNIKNLLSFNKTLDSIVTLNWRKKLNTKNVEIIDCLYSLKIKSNIDEDMDKIMDILIEKIKKIGFKMNINEKKKGELPNIDVQKVESEIGRLESQLKNRENVLVFNKLLQNYEKIIEYYSAANDDKYVEYNNKMKELLTNEKYAKYIK